MAVKLTGKNFNRSKALTNLVNKEILTPHLVKGSMEEFAWAYEFSPKEDDDAFHPSGHCVPTSTELYAMATATPEEREKDREKWASMFPTFQVGHFWHQYFQQIILRLDFADQDAIEAKRTKQWGEGPYHWATGSADVAPCTIPGFLDAVVDFKSMGNHDFKRKECPYAEKYEAQLNIYMDWFDLDTGIIVGIQKDSPHRLKEFRFERNQPLIDTIYEKWEYASHCIRDNVLPDVKDKPLPIKGPVGQA